MQTSKELDMSLSSVEEIVKRIRQLRNPLGVTPRTLRSILGCTRFEVLQVRSNTRSECSSDASCVALIFHSENTVMDYVVVRLSADNRGLVDVERADPSRLYNQHVFHG